MEDGQTIAVRLEVLTGSSTWVGFDDVKLERVANTLPVASDATFSIDENSVQGSAVGTVTATDADANDTVSVVITAGNTAGHFAIDSGTGAITTTSTALDYETATSHVLTVTATDLGGQSDTATITISVNNVVTGDDSDGDNINDDWEVANYPSTGTVSSADDTDLDGFTAFDEMVFGINPTVVNTQVEVVKSAVIDDAGTDKMELSFRRPLNYTTLGVTYALESTTTLTGWTPDSTVATSTTADADGVTEWVNYRFTLSDNTKNFIRMKVTVNP